MRALLAAAASELLGRPESFCMWVFAAPYRDRHQTRAFSARPGRAPLALPALAAARLLARPGAAARAAAAAATAEALLGAPALLGSLALLGNLTGLAAGLAAGGADLLGLPLAGLAARSPSQARGPKP